MSSSQEKTWKRLVEVKWPGEKKWSTVEDPGEYELRRALEKCEIDGYRVLWHEIRSQMLKPSWKMSNTIVRLEKKYGGTLEKDFFVENDPRVRVGRGLYDGCILTDNILKSLYIVVSHDGTYVKI